MDENNKKRVLSSWKLDSEIIEFFGGKKLTSFRKLFSTILFLFGRSWVFRWLFAKQTEMRLMERPDKGPRRKTWKEEQKKQHPTLVVGSIGRKHNARWQHRRKIGDFIRLNFFVANQNTAGYIRQKCSYIQSDGAIPNRSMLYWCFSAILQLKLGKKLLPGSYPTPSIVLSFMNQCAYWLGK